jgi:hypothetical protein
MKVDIKKARKLAGKQYLRQNCLFQHRKATPRQTKIDSLLFQ